METCLMRHDVASLVYVRAFQPIRFETRAHLRDSNFTFINTRIIIFREAMKFTILHLHLFLSAKYAWGQNVCPLGPEDMPYGTVDQIDENFTNRVYLKRGGLSCPCSYVSVINHTDPSLVSCFAPFV